MHTYKEPKLLKNKKPNPEAGKTKRTFPQLDYTNTEHLSIQELLDAKFFKPEDKSTFATRGTFVTQVIGELAKTNKSLKSPKGVEALKEVFGNKDFNLTKENLIDEIGKSLSEPFAKDVKSGDAYASVAIKGRIKASKSNHPSYPYSIELESGSSKGRISLNLFSDTVPIEQMLYHPELGDLSGGRHPQPARKFGSHVVGYAKGSVKPLSELPPKPAGEGRIGANYKVSEGVKKGVSSIDSTIADINKRSVVSGSIQNALDDFKEALRKQDATDEIVVKEVEETHSALLDVLNNEIKSSSNASKPYLLEIKKKVESLDRRLENNSNRINAKIEKQKQKRHESLQRDLDEGADLDAKEMLAEEQRKENARIDYERDMEEGADIELEQLIEESNVFEDAKQVQPINQRDVWRRYVSEKTPNGSITKNSAGFSIILNGTKLRVYNPQNVLLGIYTDLEQAKRRVQREEPKQL